MATAITIWQSEELMEEFIKENLIDVFQEDITNH